MRRWAVNHNNNISRGAASRRPTTAVSGRFQAGSNRRRVSLTPAVTASQCCRLGLRSGVSN